MAPRGPGWASARDKSTSHHSIVLDVLIILSSLQISLSDWDPYPPISELLGRLAILRTDFRPQILKRSSSPSLTRASRRKSDTPVTRDAFRRFSDRLQPEDPTAHSFRFEIAAGPVQYTQELRGPRNFETSEDRKPQTNDGHVVVRGGCESFFLSFTLHRCLLLFLSKGTDSLDGPPRASGPEVGAHQ